MSPYFEDFDKELSQGLKEAANSIVSPDRNEVWTGISREIGILIVLLTGLFAVAGDYALADFRFFQTIKSIVSNVVNISGVTRTANEVPDVGSQINQNIEEKSGEKALFSIDEARQSLDYDIAVPGYVPASYTLEGVSIRENKNSLSPVELHYIDSVSGKELIVDENPIRQVTSFSYNFRSNDAENSTVEINEYEATLIYFEKTGGRKLLWQTSETYYILSASLNEEEIVKVAESLNK